MSDAFNDTSYENLTLSKPINTYGLTELGYKIFLDRYAVKDLNKKNIKVGDIVIAIIKGDGQDVRQRRDIATVTAIENQVATVTLFPSDETITIPLAHLDKPIETKPSELHKRLASKIASYETPEKQKKWQKRYEWLLEDWRFVPGGRIMTAVGSGQDLTSYNCYVIPSPKDSRGGIFESLSDMAEIMSRGGGVGFNASSLRPKNAPVLGVNGRSSGSVSWSALFSYVTGLIEQAGSRRGALMLILNDWHPDVFDFINSKRTAGKIENANISVGVSDSFMEAVKNDDMWSLKFPDTSHPDYDNLWDGDISTWESKGLPVIFYGKPSDDWDKKTIVPNGKPFRARVLWDAIINSAWSSAEPGLWFNERSNKMSNSWYFNPLVSTNPCVTSDTLIETAHGKISAKELSETGLPVPVVVDSRFGVENIQTASHVFLTGIKPVYKMVTHSGKSVKSTSDHKFMTPDGWKKLCELNIGSFIHTVDIQNNPTLDTVTAITYAGDEQVYDLSEPTTSSFIANGIVVHNCGEQPLAGWSVCNLGAINLSQFYDNESKSIDWNGIAQASTYATRFLDTVIDESFYFMPENEQQAKRERRVGLGIMGLAELLIKAGIRYGSDEGMKTTERIFEVIATSSYASSIEIAKEKGAFPMFDADKYLSSGYMKQLSKRHPHIADAIKKYGVRNVTLLTVAPTGSTGTMVNTSTGIEPFFSWVYYRQGRLGFHEENARVVQEYADNHPEWSGNTDDLPNYFVNAMELTPLEHAQMQGAAQKWVDSAISKTVNAPNDYTIEQTSDLYMALYDLGCKGGTIYRDGSRHEQVLMLKKDDEAEINADDKTETKSDVLIDEYVPNREADRFTVKATVSDIKYSNGVSAPLPNSMNARRIKGSSPYGTVNINISEDADGNPCEVFVTIGKSGSDIQAQAEATGRLMSTSLRSQAPSERLSLLTELASQLSGIGGSRQTGFGLKRVMSLPDAIGQIITREYIQTKAHFIASEPPAKTGNEIDLTGMTVYYGDEGNAIVATPKAPEPALESINLKGADLCPECHNNTLVKADGCKKCHVCGYSEC